MKKIVIAVALAGLFSTSSAFAKTEGSYLGMELLRSNIQVKSDSDAADDVYLSRYYRNNEKNSEYGVGVSYRYAFNFNNFFIAPGVSYNFINNEVKDGYSSASNNFYSQSMKIKDQITFQTNLGYDLNGQFAIYLPVGVSSFGYEFKTNDVVGSNNVSTKKSGREFAAFYGVGFSYQPLKNWMMSLEYNKFQDLNITSGQATFNEGRIRANVGIDMVKLGVAYNF